MLKKISLGCNLFSIFLKISTNFDGFKRGGSVEKKGFEKGWDCVILQFVK